MATARPRKSPKPATAIDWSATLAAARDSLATRHVLTATDLGKLGVPPPLRAGLLDELVGPGVERTTKGVRRSLAAQLEAALATRGSLPVAGLAKAAAGGTPAEVKVATQRLLQDGRAALVVRGKAEVLMPVSEALLSRERLVALDRAVLSMAGQCKKALAAKGGPRTLLATDVQELFLDLVVGKQGGARTPTNTSPSLTEPRLLDLIKKHTQPTMGLAFVCDVVRALLPTVPLGAIHESLLAAARARRIELRPESGVGRLSELESWLCPPGPLDTRLSWVRLLEEPRS